MTDHNLTPPFSLSHAELNEVEAFASKNDLQVIRRMCEELKALRDTLKVTLHRNAAQRAMLESFGPGAPQMTYQHELDLITGQKQVPKG